MLDEMVTLSNDLWGRVRTFQMSSGCDPDKMSYEDVKDVAEILEEVAKKLDKIIAKAVVGGDFPTKSMSRHILSAVEYERKRKMFQLLHPEIVRALMGLF
jgi:hypothetical protein